jgi:hypothetical protein
MNMFFAKYKIHIIIIIGLLLFLVSFIFKVNFFRDLAIGILTGGIILFIGEIVSKKKTE